MDIARSDLLAAELTTAYFVNLLRCQLGGKNISDQRVAEECRDQVVAVYAIMRDNIKATRDAT